MAALAEGGPDRVRLCRSQTKPTDRGLQDRLPHERLPPVWRRSRLPRRPFFARQESASCTAALVDPDSLEESSRWAGTAPLKVLTR